MRYRSSSGLYHDLMLRIIKLINVIVMTMPFVIAWYLTISKQIVSPYYRLGNYLIFAIYMIIYSICCRTYDGFLISYIPVSELVYSQMLSAFMTNLLMILITCLLMKGFPNLVPFLLVAGSQILISFVWSKFAHIWYFHSFRPKKTFIVWDVRKGFEDLINSYGLTTKFDVVGDCQAEECVNNLSILDGIQTVFMSGVHSHDRNIILKYCIEKDISCFLLPRIGDVILSGAHRMHLFHLPVLRIGRYSPSPIFLFIKRLFDVLLSLAGIIVLSPIMVIVALIVKKDGGPAIYKQTRLTKDGKEFSVYKFRSMRIDAEKDGVARLSTGENDDRITSVGRVIRACRMDELPQLFNILKGDMSIVGPRPERPEIAVQYEKEMPEFRLRLQAKCGLTGYAQVYGQYNTTPYDKLQMDLMYISNPSIIQDISIMFATVKILFMKESTAGIDEGNTTA